MLFICHPALLESNMRRAKFHTGLFRNYRRDANRYRVPTGPFHGRLARIIIKYQPRERPLLCQQMSMALSFRKSVKLLVSNSPL
jgi:hypothetical protein